MSGSVGFGSWMAEIEIVPNNNAVMNINLAEDSTLWIPVEAGEESVYVTTEDGIVRFTTDEPDEKGYDGCRWSR